MATTRTPAGEARKGFAEALDKPPRNRLALEPVVECEADIDRALEELSYLRSRADTINASLAQRIKLLEKEAQNSLQTMVERKTVTFVDRAQALRLAIEEYAHAHRDELLAGDKKSREFTFGEIAWKDSAEAVRLLEGFKEDMAIDACREHQPAFVRLSYSLDRPAIKSALKAEKVTAAELASVGLEVSRGPEKFTVEPADYSIRLESREKE